MTDDELITSMHGYQPVTEGYQPVLPSLLKGFTPVFQGSDAPPATPPSGGSNVTKPTNKPA